MKPLCGVVIMAGLLAVSTGAQEPPWDPARAKPCDRACLVEIADRYIDAIVSW